jgi:hypothetical protein
MAPKKKKQTSGRIARERFAFSFVGLEVLVISIDSRRQTILY